MKPKARAGSTDKEIMQALPLTFAADNGPIKGKVNPCVERFLEHCHRRKYPNKSVIIYAGDQPDVLYYIISGSVTVLIEDENGHEIVLAYINSGGFFGEMGLFGEHPNRSAWIRTRIECEVAEISYSRFRALAREDPDILLELTAQLATRLRNTSRKVSNLAFLDVTGRIAHTLLELTREPDAMTHPDGMQIKVTRQELGRIVGCSREMAGRVLKALGEQGHIMVKGKTIVVHGAR